MAPIVVGGQIFNLPQENLTGLLSGVGDILGAIGQQRQQTRENQIFTDLSRTLQGVQQGPVQPGQTIPDIPITDPQERLNAILNTTLSGKIRSPQGISRLLNVAQIQERAIPTGTTPQRSDATITFRDKAGNVVRQQKVKLTSNQFNNVKLPEGATIEAGTPITQPSAGAAVASVREFETVTSIDPNLRKTPEYEKAFFDFKEKIKQATEGRKQLAGSTPEGLQVVFDNITGKFETVDINAQLLPKNKKLLSAEVAGQLGTFDSLITQIGDIRTLSRNNPQFIGPTEGRWNKLKSNFVNNRNFTELDRNIESLITIAYALSGKQISEREMRMLKGAILPTVTQPDANFDAALDFAEKWLTTNRDNRINRLRTSGFFVGETGNIPEGATTTQPQPRLNVSDEVQGILNLGTP